MSKLRATIEKIRTLLDGDDRDLENVLETIEHHSSRSRSEEFTLKIVTEINHVLKHEIIRVPGKAYVPARFMVFLGESDFRDLRPDKREFLESAIAELILERAKEESKGLALSVETIGIDIRVDATVNAGTVRVDPTGSKRPEDSTINEAQIDATILEVLEDEPALYQLEIWRGGEKLILVPITERTIIIGRSASGSSANVRLPSQDKRISRTHASLRLDEAGQFCVSSLHSNPTIVDSIAVPKNSESKLGSNQKFEIYEFTLVALKA